MNTKPDAILDVSGLTRLHGSGCTRCIESTGPEAGTNVCPHCGSVVACADVSFSLMRGEVLGVMGESGSGKSSLVRLLYGDDAPTRGSVRFRDPDAPAEAIDLLALNAQQARRLRNRRFGIVYQNPHLGLNFQVSAGGNIAERLLMSGEMRYAHIRERAMQLLSRCEVPATRMDELPGRFSGGMQQRVQIARALATDPPLLFLDEVTTGLDVSVQARILDLILELQHQLGVSMIAVTHDLGVIRMLASRTLVMKMGRVVESGLTDQILEDPQHAYTQQLVASAL
ncbi:ATP-binding cassette domain-containing protein [Methylibium petroleiphilum]|uniref:ABC type ATPase n=1 Tax=Methylibium petroleiphilum (strain ATCC BAA-1232 / LMG 22953 / PM1) TaxID=420662 RepID=A2SNR4_METPP|nr:ATP-binding cassette domain-containing protein [Methylibium petroleiphilum]ABM97203.1 ABC type ATPase [Methylibium petroleiphilum PM1]ABM97237.1 ABC type ATPase [Methylibium petroleiphilum PM1]